MRAISEWLNNVAGDGRATAAPARSVRPLGEAELDRIAAAGGSKNGGLGSGGGSGAQILNLQPN
jgi:hypothetical protein